MGDSYAIFNQISLRNDVSEASASGITSPKLPRGRLETQFNIKLKFKLNLKFAKVQRAGLSDFEGTNWRTDRITKKAPGGTYAGLPQLEPSTRETLVAWRSIAQTKEKQPNNITPLFLTRR